nr:fimbrial protein [Pantoea sp. 1.19]
MTALLCAGAVCLSEPALARVDNWDVDGANGVIYVHGELHESACRLEMTSSRQEVALGDLATARLSTPGARGASVPFQLRLRDCQQAPPASALDERTGNRLASGQQPAVTVSFNAARDADNPQLVQAHGTSGLGLRLLDVSGRDVRLGSRGIPLWLTRGQNTLNFTVTPERTSAPLKPGYFMAMVNVNLSYD